MNNDPGGQYDELIAELELLRDDHDELREEHDELRRQHEVMREEREQLSRALTEYKLVASGLRSEVRVLRRILWSVGVAGVAAVVITELVGGIEAGLVILGVGWGLVLLAVLFIEALWYGVRGKRHPSWDD